MGVPFRHVRIFKILVNHLFFIICINRSSKEITIEGFNVPGPIIDFSDYDLPDFFMREATRQNFDAPTPIQAQSWPICLSGRDLIGIARVCNIFYLQVLLLL